MQTRQFLKLSTIAVAGLTAAWFTRANNREQKDSNIKTANHDASVKKITLSDLKKLAPNPTVVTPIKLSPEEWKMVLNDAQYHVLRKAGTERAGTSHLNNEKREGEYACAGCGLVLFQSNTKYDSGTGWPSFFRPVAGRLGTSTDFKIGYPRTEYHCARCKGHQGHVFKDGPQPTGLRYCNNGVALTFVPAEA